VVASLTLKRVPLEPTDVRFPINLATALRLSDARPLMVASAQAGVWHAEAQLTQAKVLWVPSAMIGVDYLRHDGGGPDFNKGIMTAPSVNYFDAGAGLYLFLNLTDAYFEPLVARQVLNAAHWDTQAAKNDALQRTADAYFRVHQYRGMYAGALYTVELGRDLVDKVSSLSADLVPRVEVDRARNMLADLEQRAVLARQEWRVASADVTQVLRLDPRAVVVPLEHDHTQVTLIDPGRSLDDLMPIALTNRPELASRRAQLQAAEYRVRREKMRPVLPIVNLGGFQTPGMYYQGSLFGLGPNSSLNQYRGRGDVSIQLVWQLESLGIGNLARIKASRGNESRAVIELRDTQDAVAADVNRALARVQSAAARITQADRALRTGIITFHGHLEGLGQTRRLENVLILTFRPQEAVYSLDLLNVSFNEYFTTVADYNRAQFELFHALGYPAAEIARLSPVGTVEPVNTARPAFLSPVGNGPPPATR
jgi:outer membrane protein TolC